MTFDLDLALITLNCQEFMLLTLNTPGTSQAHRVQGIVSLILGGFRDSETL